MKYIRIIAVIVFVGIAFAFYYTIPTVEEQLVESYNDYLQNADSTMQSKQLIKESKHLTELKADSVRFQTSYPNEMFFIVQPQLIEDSIVSGQLHVVHFIKSVTFFDYLKQK